MALPLMLVAATVAPAAVYYLRIPRSLEPAMTVMAAASAVLALASPRWRASRSCPACRAVLWIAAGLSAYAVLTLQAMAVPRTVGNLLGLSNAAAHDLVWYDAAGAASVIHEKTWERDLRGEIISAESRSDGSVRLMLQMTDPALGKIVLLGRERVSELRPGRVLEARASLYVPATTDNPGAFSYRRYLARQGAYLAGTVTSLLQVRDPTSLGGRLRSRLHEVRERLSASFGSLPSEERALLEAVAFGRRRDLPADLEDKFRTLGVYHYLSVSGLHVGVVTAFAGFVARLLGAGRTVAKAGAVVGAWSFAVLSGPAVPALRAALMLTFGLLGDRRSGGSRRSLRGLLVAAVALLTLKPLLVFDAGFQLSFVATAGVLLVVAGLSGRGKPASRTGTGSALLARVRRSLVVSLAVSIGAQLAILPMLLRYFGGVALFAPLHTLVLMAPFSGALIVGLVVGAAGAVHGAVPQPVQALAALPVVAILRYVDWAGGLPAQFLAPGDPGLPAQLVLAVAAVWCGVRWASANRLPPRLKRLRTIGAARVGAAAVVLSLGGWAFGFSAPAPGTLSVTFLSVGEGLSVFVRTPSGLNVLADAGGRLYRPTPSGSGFDIGRDVVTPYLRHVGAVRLHVAVATHNHADHVQGFNAVGRAETVERLLLPRLADPDAGAAESVGPWFGVGAANSAPRTYMLGAGDVIKLRDGVELEFLNPVPGVTDSMDANNSSLVFRLKYGAFRLLLTADLETQAIEEIRRYWPGGEAFGKGARSSWGSPGSWRADVMLVPHHGSGGEGHADLIDLVDPAVAVISVGKNRFGHPDPRLIKALARERRAVFRTDINGAVRIETDGVMFRVAPLRSAPTPWLWAKGNEGRESLQVL